MVNRGGPTQRLAEALAGAGLVLAVSGCTAATTADPMAHAIVSIETSSAPRMTAQQVADVVVTQIHANEQMLGRTVAPIQILSITAVTGDRIAEVLPQAGQGHPPPAGIIWVVRTEGTFTTNRGPPAVAASPPAASSGYYLITDADGGVIGMGFPLATPTS